MHVVNTTKADDGRQCTITESLSVQLSAQQSFAAPIAAAMVNPLQKKGTMSRSPHTLSVVWLVKTLGAVNCAADIEVLSRGFFQTSPRRA